MHTGLSEAATRLLPRLDAIGAALAPRDSARALLALGSIGEERWRLDRYSDLDFFVIVRDGTKQPYLNAIDWLEEAHPVAWSFANTKDGRKALFADRIFCEYAVFEEREMPTAQFASGKIVWMRPGFDVELCKPRLVPTPLPNRNVEWIVGEALTNLYIGLSRFRRGEKWTAAIFVQNFALYRIVDLLLLESDGDEAGRDPYTIDRRFEERHPVAASVFAACMQGYERTPESALAILEFIEARHPVDPLLAEEIRLLAAGA